MAKLAADREDRTRHRRPVVIDSVDDYRFSPRRSGEPRAVARDFDDDEPHIVRSIN